jgi:hypothetical protein
MIRRVAVIPENKLPIRGQLVKIGNAFLYTVLKTVIGDIVGEIRK